MPSIEERHSEDPDRAGEDRATDSIVDPITGLPDLRFFLLVIDNKISLARRTLTPLSVGLMQIDDWNRRGLEQRQRALRHVSSILQTTLRSSDTVCTIGHGRLGVILDDAPETGAVWAADRVRTVLEDRPSRPVVSLSVGLACYPSHALDADDVLAAAETALSSASCLGPARIEVASLV